MRQETRSFIHDYITEICNKKYCEYCGETSKVSHENYCDEKEDITFIKHYCDCDNAKIHEDIKCMQNKLEWVKKRNKIIHKLRYEDDLKRLNDKYSEYFNINEP